MYNFNKRSEKVIYRESNVGKTILDKIKVCIKVSQKQREYRLWLSSNRTKTQSVEQVSLTLVKSWLCYQRP